ncbi:PAS domain-containing sensor histidine kinase [Flammeovirga sp. EKP202]|uniref:PAS domain-containing sensor histidine kinase n=1 Tax=Flammeovirga sp. EKP202 TaxID=2770592 RepID=UPI00165FDBCD|nr:PAS domain-containing sensor histidine kinase [Flammeovirga sp. EKP202]MBD0400867.1 PAS domain-containing sensor histidine kinase [Flammeovirga sp. EKP202]
MNTKTKIFSIASLILLTILLVFPNTRLIGGIGLSLETVFLLLFILDAKNSNSSYLLLQKLYDHVFVFDKNWKLTFTNDDRALKSTLNSAIYPITNEVIHDLKNDIPNHYGSYEYQLGNEAYDLKCLPVDKNASLMLIKDITDLKRKEQKLSSLNIELKELLHIKKDELRLKKEKFKTIFDKSSDAYFLLDSQFNISIYNEKVTNLFGKVNEISFYNWLSRHAPREQMKGGRSIALFKSMQKSCDAQGELRFEWQFFTSNGEEFSTEISLTLLPISQQIVYFMIIRNMMDQKKIETELRKNLDREKELNEMRSKFISMASHEFKTPLATIMTNMDIIELALKKRALNLGDLKIEKFFTRMRSESKRLNLLLDEVLQLGKIEAGKTPFAPQNISIDQFIDEYLTEFNNRTHPQQDIILHKEVKRNEVWIDPTLMGHILDNLVSNAIKYSDKEVYLRLFSSEEALRIEVEDHGIGIPLSDFSNLFESFFRASNTEHVQGTGLGLVIAKEFVEMHGGVIVCESEEGKGSVFRIAIPFN